jgi:SAM-dependent MidA family methyltransferase
MDIYNQKIDKKIDEKNGRVVLEKNVRFSRSLLWEAQRRYFDEAGVDAWSGAVPFYITSNPLIADSYAKVLIRWVQDLLSHHRADPLAPFYIFELGTGSGRFSFMTMRRLFELQKALNISAKIIYVMTDFTASNLNFWENHEKLKPFIESGQLDFAVYDMEKDIELNLLKSGKTLSVKDVKNPIALIGNYIFDTVSDDAFYVENGQLYESLITVDAAPENVDEGMPIKLENLGCSFTHEKMREPCYEDPIWNQALMGSVSAITHKGAFLLPVGGFKSLDMFRTLSNNRLLLISTDKGYSSPEEMEGREDSKLVFHGSFSMTVNFHGIGEYFKALGGDVAFQSSRDSIKTCVYVMGADFKTLPEVKLAIADHIQGFGPGDYFSLHRNIREMKDPQISMTTLLAQMALCQWDPYVLSCFINRVLSELPKAAQIIIRGFAEGADKILENIYMMPGVEDYYFNVGLLYHHGGRYAKAIECYFKSLETHGEKFATYYNLALCRYMAGDVRGSLEYFELSLPFDTDKRASEWLKKVKSEIPRETQKSQKPQKPQKEGRE